MHNQKSRILFTEQPLVVNTELAKIIGLNEAIVTQQISYWLDINMKARKKPINGRYWTYNSVNEWQETNFPFWSVDTIRRTLKKLEKLGIVISDNHHKSKMIKSLWYSIDYDKLDEIVGAYYGNNETDETSVKADNSAFMQNAQMDNNPFMQNAQMDLCKMPKSITENTKENKEEEEEEKGICKNRDEALTFAKGFLKAKIKHDANYEKVCNYIEVFIEDIKSLRESSIKSYCLKILEQHDKEPVVEQEQPKAPKAPKQSKQKRTYPAKNTRTEIMPAWDNEPINLSKEEEEAQLAQIKELMGVLK